MKTDVGTVVAYKPGEKYKDDSSIYLILSEEIFCLDAAKSNTYKLVMWPNGTITPLSARLIGLKDEILGLKDEIL